MRGDWLSEAREYDEVDRAILAKIEAGKEGEEVMAKRRPRGVPGFNSRSEKFLSKDGSRVLTIALRKNASGVYVIMPRMKTAGEKALRGEQNKYSILCEAEARIEYLIGLAVANGWTRKASRRKFDFEGIPEA